jgi:hypothetical protein
MQWQKDLRLLCGIYWHLKTLEMKSLLNFSNRFFENLDTPSLNLTFFHLVQVSKLLRPSLEDLKSSMEAGTKAIVNFLTGERNNPLLDSIHQKTKKKHNNKHRNDQRS